MYFDGLAKHLSTLNEGVDKLLNMFDKFAYNQKLFLNMGKLVTKLL